METTIAQELHRIFDIATLRKEARAIKSSRQWSQAAEITRRCDNARAQERVLYADRYESRVELVRRRLIDEAGRKGFDLRPRWAGNDRFDAAGTLRQAQREVRDAHYNRIARIDEIERRELKSFMVDCMRQNNLRGKPREDFGRAVDRRSGGDRRVIQFSDYTGPKRRR